MNKRIQDMTARELRITREELEQVVGRCKRDSPKRRLWQSALDTVNKQLEQAS